LKSFRIFPWSRHVHDAALRDLRVIGVCIVALFAGIRAI
jgi:hypothetical protein